jgi:multidrug transporter EmrE-like cation transporter
MFTAVIGQVFFKKGLVGTELAPNLKSIISVVFTPTLLFGFFFYGLSAILWLFVLKRFPLSVAYPSLSLTYVLILFISVVYFGESLSILKFLGIFLIFGGVILINI